MSRSPAVNDYDGWVAHLANSGRRAEAKRHLMVSGAPALPALRRGLRHPKAVVRRLCVNILDHVVDEDALVDLAAALDDEDPTVVARALHALACDACKENACRPNDDLYVPRALAMLREHPDPDLRAAAIDSLSRIAKRRPDVLPALVTAAERDPDPNVRNMARLRSRRFAGARQGRTGP